MRFTYLLTVAASALSAVALPKSDPIEVRHVRSLFFSTNPSSKLAA